MASAIRPISTVRRSPRPVELVLGFAAMAVLGLGVGGFLLPSAPGRPTPGPVAAPEPAPPAAVAPPTEKAPAIEVVVRPEPARPVTAVTASRKVDLSDPVTPPVLPNRGDYDLTRKIDRQIETALAKSEIPVSPLASDAEFLRRASLDLTGKVPTYERVVAFLADTDPTKRAKLIDELLASDAYGKHFAAIWTDALIKRDADTNRGLKTEDFTAWLAKQFNENRGWDKIVTEMITASGKVDDHPATLFVLANQDNNLVSPAKLVGATANLFMGLQLQCAECHVHPHVDEWKQDDFWAMAAFFGHTKFERDTAKAPRGPVSEVKEVARQAEPRGKAARFEKAIPAGDSIAIPDPTDAKKTIGTAKARLFESKQPANLGNAVPYRPKLASWLTSADNKYFARATVNRTWAHFFAKGIIHPVEDMGPGSEPTHPELLDELTKAFAASQFDLKSLIRAYCNSQAYNRTSKPLAGNAEDATLLSHMPIKVLGARELVDSVVTLQAGRSGANNRLEARQLQREKAKGKLSGPATGVRFFDKREYEDEVTAFSYGIPQLLKLMNTQLTNNSGMVARFAKPGRDRDAVIVDLYLAALGRRPKVEELDRLESYIESRPKSGYQDIFWALLNSAEFLSNH